MKLAPLISFLLFLHLNLSGQFSSYEGISMRYYIEDCTLFLEVTASWQFNGDTIDFSNTQLLICENPNDEPLYLLTECNSVKLPNDIFYVCGNSELNVLTIVSMVIHVQKVDKKVGYSAGLCIQGMIDNCLTYSAYIGPYEGEIPHMKYDTITFYDTIPVYDTVMVFDTIPVYDTIPAYVTVYDSIAVTDTLFIDAVLSGFDSPENIATIKVYPNPAKDHLSISVGDYNRMHGYRLKIINQLGVVVFETDVEAPLYGVNLSDWSGMGLYYIQVIDSGGSLIDVRKIILR